jgi:outer membrane protein assembly factor BamD
MSRIPIRTFGSIAWLPLALALGACAGSNRYESLDAETLFLTAQAEYEEGEYDNAISALERLMVAYQSSPRVPDGRFLLAQSYFDKGEFVTARAEYLRFLDRYIGHESSAAAALGMCKSLAELVPNPERDQGFTFEAITMCGNVIIDYAGSPESTEAAGIRQSMRDILAEKDFLIARGYFRRRQYDPAIKYFQFVVDGYPETEFAPQALLGIYRGNEAIGYEDLAAEARSRLLGEYPNSAEAAELLLDPSAS